MKLSDHKESVGNWAAFYSEYYERWTYISKIRMRFDTTTTFYEKPEDYLTLLKEVN